MEQFVGIYALQINSKSAMAKSIFHTDRKSVHIQQIFDVIYKNCHIHQINQDFILKFNLIIQAPTSSNNFL